MRNIIIVSRGQEVARVSYDTKGGAPKAMSYEPLEGETNRANCLAITVHSLEQLNKAEIKDSVMVYSLNLISNSIGKLYNTKKTLKAVDIEDKEQVLEAFFDGMNVTEQEQELWNQFFDLDEEMVNVKYRSLPNKDSVTKMKKSTSGFDRNLAKAIETAWERLPQIEMDAIEEDEAI